MIEMSSRERLLKAISGEEPDRVPVCPNLVLWAADKYGDFGWRRQLELAGHFGMDAIVDLEFRVPAFLLDPGADAGMLPAGVSVEVSPSDEGEMVVYDRTFHTPAGPLTDRVALGKPRSRYGLCPSPAWRERLVKSAEDVEKVFYLLPAPEALADPCWSRIEEAVGHRGILRIHVTHGASTAVMPMLMGMERAMVAFYEDRPLFDRLLDILASHFQRVTRRMLECGAKYVFVSWHNLGVSAGWSPEVWRAAFKPVIRANVELVHGYGALYHYFDNGPVMCLLADIAELGVDSISSLCPPPMGDVDLAQAKAIAGDRLCLIGNVDAVNVMQKGRPEDVRRAVREAIEAGAPGGRFILGNSDSFFPGTPAENIEAFFRAARDYGSYPIRMT